MQLRQLKRWLCGTALMLVVFAAQAHTAALDRVPAGNTPPPEPDKPHCTDGCGKESGGAGATAGDPIDLYTGEFSYEETDAVVGGLAPLSIPLNRSPVSLTPSLPDHGDHAAGPASRWA